VRHSGAIVHDLTRVVSFTEQVERHGMAASARILAAAAGLAPDQVACALGIEPGAAAVRLERVRFAGGEPVTLEDSWLPAHRFPGLLQHDLTGSLYALMGSVFGLAPVSATEQLEPVAARSFDAETLRVALGSPLMLVERTGYAADGTAVEYARDRHRGDRARFVIRVVPDGVLAGAR
jgi:GntR family transcriptional regulator